MRQPGALLHEALGALVAGEPLLALADLVLVPEMLDERLPTGESLAALVARVLGVAGQVPLERQLHGEASVAVGTDQRADAWPAGNVADQRRSET